MADEEKKRPVVASLVFATISAMVLSPLYPIALGFKELAGSAGGTGSTLTAVLYALPVLGAVVTGAGMPRLRLLALTFSR